MKGFLQPVLAVLMTFLPPRYRAEAARLRPEAMVGGILQCAVAMGYLLYRFSIFSSQRPAIIVDPALTPSNRPDVNAIRGGGILMMAEFIFQPVNVFLLYLFYEGLVRYMAARISHQVIGTLPLYAISGVHELVDRAKYRRYVGPAMPDEV